MTTSPTVYAKVRAFLRNHPHCDIIVLTGYTSAKGISWLGEHVSKEQKVTIVVGDVSTHILGKNSIEDRESATRFLQQDNVSIHHWYRKHPIKKMAHGKAFIAMNKGHVQDALVGSANLTRAGLSQNLELMTRCHPDEHKELKGYFEEATKHPKLNSKVIEALNTPPSKFKSYVNRQKDGVNKKEDETVHQSQNGTSPLEKVIAVPIKIARRGWQKIQAAIEA